jgi:tetratricopeptide (TPR) repeat protein
MLAGLRRSLASIRARAPVPWSRGWLFLPALLLASLVAGCAPRTAPAAAGPVPGTPFDPASDALVARGCYRCLERAYQAAQARGARQSAFEAAALLVLRSKELGLPSGEWLDRARALVAVDGSSGPLLDIVEAIPPDRTSEERDVLFEPGRRQRVTSSLDNWRAALQHGPASSHFRAYLDVSLVCAFGRLRENAASFSGALDDVVTTPLYQYALGVCDATHAERLAVMRAASPEFVDADFALGRYAIEDPLKPDPEEGLRRLRAVSAEFPRSPVIAVRVAEVYRAWEEWAPALEAFDTALAVAPRHPEATIGRAISLSYLGRSDEAIAATTQLIEDGQWHLGQAFYWRGWNYLKLGDYQRARADADRARTLMANAAVYVLSGVIEWRLGRLESAERDFQDAITMDLGECDGAFDLGVVRDLRGKMPEALAAFKQAGQCVDLSIALRREAIAKIQAGPGTATPKARDSVRHERLLVDLQERREEIARLVGSIETVSEAR